MTKLKYEPASKKQLEDEARQWDSRALEPGGWIDAPEAIPRMGASTLISLRMPNQMLEILKMFARKEGIGYQVLLKRWVDERIHEERKNLASRQIKLYQPRMVTLAATFSPREEQILDEVKEKR